MWSPSRFVFAALGLLTFAAAPPLGAQDGHATPAGTSRRVTVVVTGLRNDAGRVVGGLYGSADHWLEHGHADGDCRARIRHGRARCVFAHAPAGPVAFAGMHDEDEDGALDRDLLGVPSEGYAFSNDVHEPLGPPSFDAASFVASSLVVHVRYGI
jgi:uncharacterized protein (DUF2141 family)